MKNKNYFEKISSAGKNVLVAFFTIFICALICNKADAQLYWNTNGTLANWTAANWSTTGSAPFTSAWVNNSNSVFQATSAITYVTNTPIGNVTVNPGFTVTVTAAGTCTTGGNVRTIDVGAGSTLAWAGQNVSAAAAGTGFIKNGTGIWDIGAQGNLYLGGFTMNAGTVNVTGNNSFGGGTLTITGGTIFSTGGRNFGATSLTISGNFTFTGTGNATFGMGTAITGATRTITNSITGGSRILGGAITAGAGIGLTVGGTGTTVLTGVNNYPGLTTVTGGTLQLANTAGTTLPSANSVTVTGGTLEIAESQTLTNVTISSGANLNVATGKTLTILGTLTNNGTVKLNGTLTNSGTVIINGTLDMSEGSNATGTNFTYGASSLLNYSGTTAQTTANKELPNSNGPHTLSINIAAGVTLHAARTIPILTIGDATSGSVFNDGGFQVTSTGTLNLVSGSFKIGTGTNNTSFPAFTTANISAGTTVDYGATNSQTIAPVNYAILTNSGNGNRTFSPTGTIGVSEAGSLGTGAYTVTGSTLNISISSNINLPIPTPVSGGANYNNLIISGTGFYVMAASMTLGGNLTVNSNTGIFSITNSTSKTLTVNGSVFMQSGTFNGNSISTNGSTLATLTISGSYNQSGGTFNADSANSNTAAASVGITGTFSLTGGQFRLISNSSGSAAVTVTGSTSVNAGGTDGIYFETVSAGSGVATFQANGGATFQGASTSLVDFGTGSVAGNQFGIVGNFSQSGTGTFTTTSGNAANGFVFNGTGTQASPQTLSYSGSTTSNKTNYKVNSTTAVKLLSGLTIGTNSTFTVDHGILDFDTWTVTGSATSNFYSNYTSTSLYSTLISANTNGIYFGTTGSVSNAIGSVFLLTGTSYIFNSSVSAQNTHFKSNPIAQQMLNLTINNSNGVTLTEGVTIDGVLTFTSGKINNPSPNQVLFNSTATSTGAGPGKFITGTGTIRTDVAIGNTTKTIPIGDALYAGVNITFTGTGATAAGNIITTVAAIDVNEGANLSGINQSQKVNRYWFLNGTPATLGTYDITLNFESGNVTGGLTSNFLIRKFSSGAWATTTLASGGALATSTKATGLTSFSDFEVGEKNTVVAGSNPASDTRCVNGTATFTTTASGSLPTPSIKWQEKVGAGPFNDITDGGIYGGSTTTTLTITGVTVGMTGNQYRADFRNINSLAGTTSTSSVTLTVNSPSAAPTGISGTTALCNGDPTTLTATGGTLGTGANYQWGTGAVVGTSALFGQTASTLNVSPTGNTTYWVWIENTAAPCTGTTAGVTELVTVNQPSVAPTGISGTTTLCSGDPTTLTATGGTPGTGANYQWGTGAVVGTSPLFGQTASTLNVTPAGNTTYWVRIENTTAPCTGNTGGVTQLVTVNQPSTAPTGISGTTTLCNGDPTTLTAMGGTPGTGANYQWGTGSTPGVNPLSGQTASTLNVSPISNTTYWVWIENTAAPCTGTTGGVTQLVTVNQPSVAPTGISGTTTLCSGDPTTLTATGGNPGTGANYQWGTGAIVGTSPLFGQTASTLNVSPIGNTTYWVRIENTAAPCTGNTAGVTQLVTVYSLSTAPTSITSNDPDNEICSGSPVLLTANGGALGSSPGTSYKWYEGGCGTGSVLGSSATLNLNGGIGNPPVPSVGTHTYYVRIEDPCGNTSCSSLLITVISGPPAANTISAINGAPGFACSGTVVLLTATSAGGPGITYSWNNGSGSNPISYSNNIGGPFTPGPFTTTANQVYAQFGAICCGQSGYHACVQAVNACGSTSNKCAAWVQGQVSGPASINPPTAVTACPNDVKSYTCGSSTGATVYNWTLSGSSLPITTGQGSTSVQVTFPAAFTSGSLCVTAALTCGGTSTSAPRCMTISKTPATPFPIAGPSTICPGATNVSYSIPVVAGATGYNWTVPAGVTITGGQNTTSITVNFPTPYNGAPSICVTALNSPCANSAGRCLSVYSGIPSQPAAISGPLFNLCGSTVQYSVVNPVAGLTYTWANPAGTTISSGQNTSAIQLSVSSTFYTGTLSVVANSMVCPPATSLPRVSSGFWGRPNTPGVISQSGTLCQGFVNNFSVVNQVPGPVPTYQWTSSNGVINAGQGSNNIDVTWGSNASGTITVNASNTCGLNTAPRSQVFTTACRLEGTNTSSATAFSVYPNPAHDKITVSIDVKEQAQFNVKLRDMSGRVILSEDHQAEEGLNAYNMDMKGFAKGIYTMEVQSANDSWKTKVIIE